MDINLISTTNNLMSDTIFQFQKKEFTKLPSESNNFIKKVGI